MATALLDDDATTARASLYVGSGGTLDDGGTVTVDYGGDAETDGTLEIAGSLDIAGSGTMNDYGNVLIDSGGYAEFDGAAINDWPDNGGLPIQNSGTIQIDDDNLSLLAAGVISNSGTVCFAYDGTVNLSDLTLSGGTYEISGSTTATINSNMTLDNTYLQIDSGATLELNAALAVTDGGGVDNDGTADFNSAGSVTADDSSSIYNDADGTINAYGGLDISGTFSNSGTLNIASGGSVTIESAATFTDTGTLSVVDNGAITNDGIADLSGITLDTATASAIDNSGTVYIAAGDLSGLTLAGGTWAIAPNASASVSGSLTLANATLLIGYDTTLNVDGGTVAPDDNTSLAPSSIENYGTIDCSDGGTVYPALLGAPVLYQPASPEISINNPTITIDNTTITLTWTYDHSVAPGGWVIEEEDCSTGNFFVIPNYHDHPFTFTQTGDSWSTLIPALNNCDGFVARVEAVAPGAGVYSVASNEVAAGYYDSYGGPYAAEAAPTNLTVAPTAMPSVMLNWNNDTNDETGYNIYRGTDDTFADATVIPGSGGAPTVGPDVTSYLDSNVDSGQTYYYWVSAVYSSSEDVSGPVSATLPGQVYSMTVTDDGSGTPATVDQGQPPPTLDPTEDSSGDEDLSLQVIANTYSNLYYQILNNSNGQPVASGQVNSNGMISVPAFTAGNDIVEVGYKKAGVFMEALGAGTRPSDNGWSDWQDADAHQTTQKTKENPVVANRVPPTYNGADYAAESEQKTRQSDGVTSDIVGEVWMDNVAKPDGFKEDPTREYRYRLVTKTTAKGTNGAGVSITEKYVTVTYGTGAEKVDVDVDLSVEIKGQCDMTWEVWTEVSSRPRPN